MKHLVLLSVVFYCTALIAQDSSKKVNEFALEGPVYSLTVHKVVSHWLWPLGKVRVPDGLNGPTYRRNRRKQNRLRRVNSFSI